MSDTSNTAEMPHLPHLPPAGCVLSSQALIACSIVDENQIPYLDFAHTTLLPEDMIKHMNRDVISALSPRNAPRPMYLFDQCREFARTLSRHFGIAVPDVNAPPVLWRTISALGGSRQCRTPHPPGRLQR
jgi:hypothetical protein